MCLLDQADGLTKQAQNALLRIMEMYHTNVRFILTANVLGKLSQMMVSRCSVFHLRGLHPAHMEQLLGRICLKEGNVIDVNVRQAIISSCHGDARLAINLLEAMMNLENPTPADVFSMIGRTDDANVYQLLHRAVKGKFEAYTTLQTLLERNGVNPSEMIAQIFWSVLKGSVRGLTDEQRARILMHLGNQPYMTDDIKLASFLSKLVLDDKLRA